MSQTQASALLLGLALGDALGYPVEFLNWEVIVARFGPQGILEPPDPALYTDDTQMTLATAEALIKVGHLELEYFMTALGNAYLDWLFHPQNNRAPGNTCIRGLQKYAANRDWRNSGLVNSKGCGSAMRVAPLGYFFQHDADRLRAFSLASGLITHRHPAAQAASVAAAYLAKLALDGLHPREWLNPTLAFVQGMSEEFDAALYRLGHVEGWVDRRAALGHIGQGWTGEEAVAMALYCVRQHPDDYPATVRLAANLTGDSDSVASIAGGLSAARLGLEAIPAAWVARCENASGLQATAVALAAHRSRHIPL
ncbi:MAG: ADP-ribosylglycohydrolase family protein [Anaerolineae bacterium]|nr:ADP-ribosylglycohydrolase family protein [Anaerolineae bacterium]